MQSFHPLRYGFRRWACLRSNVWSSSMKSAFLFERMTTALAGTRRSRERRSTIGTWCSRVRRCPGRQRRGREFSSSTVVQPICVPRLFRVPTRYARKKELFESPKVTNSNQVFQVNRTRFTGYLKSSLMRSSVHLCARIFEIFQKIRHEDMKHRINGHRM